MTPDGEIESIHAQPWSTILRVPVAQGDVFFKASSDESIFEVALAQVISSVAPEAMPGIVALDTERGWLLMRDGGQRLRETLIESKDMAHWERLLPVYADLQIKLAERQDAVRATGIPVRTLDAWPGLYADLLADAAMFRVDQENGMSAGDYQRLQDLREPFAQKCAALAGYAIPPSVHHGDLHDGNIFHDGTTHYRFVDWGDASLSHPFFSLRTAYVSAEIRFDLDEHSPELNRLRDAYLPAWRAFETEQRLLDAFTLAKQLWAFSSMLSWYRGLSVYLGKDAADYAHVIPSLGQELLDYFDREQE